MNSLILIASENLFLISGLVLIGLVVIQMAFWVSNSFSSFTNHRKQHQLSLKILQEKLQTAQAERTIAESETSWQGFRNFVVSRLEKESRDVVSIYLKPQDGRPLPLYKPGQYLTFSVEVPGQAKPQVRCYSLSHAPNSEYYRCTVKRIRSADLESPSGMVSSYFNEGLQEGDVLPVKAPSGAFFLELNSDQPVILLAAGIGVTPIFSMLDSIIRFQPHRRVVMFYGVRNGEEHALKNEIKTIAAKNRNVHVLTCFSNPLPTDRAGIDYDLQGRVSIELLKNTIPSANFQFMLCGPGSFMSSMVEGLQEWGVPENQVQFEAFGPSTVRKVRKRDESNREYLDQTATIEFCKSKITATWNSDFESILEAAEENDVPIESGCRAGNCGTCELKLKKGKVDYAKQIGNPPEEGKILSCVARPTGDIEIDA